MPDIDWIQLWMLNELVTKGCQASDLIYHPRNGNPNYWLFPSRAAFCASPEMRADALRRCMEQELVHVYSDSSLHSQQFDALMPCRPNAFPSDDIKLMSRFEAILTQKGHEKWEAEFQPNWGRYWKVTLDELNESGTSRLIFIQYSSNKLLDDITQFFPFYRNVGDWVQLGFHTAFQVQATSWKVIPVVKVGRWAATVADDTIEDIKKLPPEQRKATIAHLLRARSEQFDRARLILTKLSEKWICTGFSDDDFRDSVPQLAESSRTEGASPLPETGSPFGPAAPSPSVPDPG